MPLLRDLWWAGVALLLAGCAGEQSALIGAGASTGQGGTVLADAVTTGESTAEASSGPQPFGAIPDPSAGARTVLANPTLAEVMQAGELPEMSLGRADAPVTLIQYASMTCPHCRAFHKTTFPALKREYIDTGKVRFILREFPIGKTSGAATIALRCAPPDKYFQLYGKFMESQPSWVSQEVRLDPIFEVAKQVGMTRSQFDACQQNQGMINALKWVKERGRTLGVIGTPNFFVQGKLVKSELTIEELRALINPLLRSAGTTAEAAGPAR